MAKNYYKPPLSTEMLKILTELREFDQALKKLTQPKLIEFCIEYTHEQYKKKKERKEER